MKFHFYITGLKVTERIMILSEKQSLIRQVKMFSKTEIVMRERERGVDSHECGLLSAARSEKVKAEIRTLIYQHLSQ